MRLLAHLRIQQVKQFDNVEFVCQKTAERYPS